MDEEDSIKVLLPLSQIPIGSTVTKKTGEKPYVVVDNLRMFTVKPMDPIPSIFARDGTRFLVSHDPGNAGDINVYPGDTEMLWVTTAEELYGWLEGQLEDEGK